VQFILLTVWSRRRTELSRKVMLVGLVVFPLLVLIQALVVTDRERLTSVCESLARAVRDADVDAFDDHLVDGFRFDGEVLGRSLDRATTRERLEHTLTRYRIEDPRLSHFEIEIDGVRATVRFTARCRVVSAERIQPSLSTSWELTFHKTADRWLVTSARNIDLRPWF
jgi:hypothetical protein